MTVVPTAAQILFIPQMSYVAQMVSFPWAAACALVSLVLSLNAEPGPLKPI